MESGPAAPDPAALPALIESLLFVASGPTPVGRLAQVLDASPATVEDALAVLSRIYDSEGRGLRIQRHGDRVQLTTTPDAAPYVRRFLGLDFTSRLSQAAMETLAVIAYRQPVTRAEIEMIRGVNCDAVLHTLIVRGLVESVGRVEQAGRPFLYGTTLQFLQYFGLSDMSALPPLPEGAA